MSESKMKKQVVDLSSAIYQAMNELGIPQPGYPAPVANAYNILWQAVGCPTKYAPDVASAASAEPDSGLESVPAVESDTQPRG
jgi:hypothetical protein